MSESKWTPGPWLIRSAWTSTGRGPEIYTEGPHYDDGSEFVVAEFPSSEHRPRGAGRWKRVVDADAIEANAQLISAAPEMYEALEDCVAELQVLRHEFRPKKGIDSLVSKALIKGLNAIAKARGEA